VILRSVLAELDAPSELPDENLIKCCMEDILLAAGGVGKMRAGAAVNPFASAMTTR
jgi:hypothetical protein